MEGDKYIVYVLVLQDDYYYIGSTSNIASRLTYHQQAPNKFVIAHGPIKHHCILAREATRRRALDMERTFAEGYAEKYGYDHVMGGGYVNWRQFYPLANQTRHLNNLCFRCGQPGHYMKDCTQTAYPLHPRLINQASPSIPAVYSRKMLWADAETSSEDGFCITFCAVAIIIFIVLCFLRILGVY